MPAAERFGGVGRGGRDLRLAVAAGARVGDIPRPRRVRAGRRAAGRRGAARLGGRAARARRARRARATARRAGGGALVAHVVGDRRLRQRALDAAHDDLVGAACGSATRSRRAARRRVRGVVARTFSDVAPGGLLLYEDAGGALALAVNGGDAAALLGLRRATRCGWSARDARPAAAAPARDRLDQRARARAGRGRRAARHAGHRRRADRRPRTAGPHVDGAARDARCCSRWWSASPIRCCRCAPASRSPTSPGAAARVKWPNDVLLDGRKVAGMLVEGRPQEGWAVLGIGVNAALDVASCRRSCANAGTLGRAPGELEPTLDELLGASSRGWPSPPPRRSRRCARATRCSSRPVSWAGGEGVGAGIDDDGRLRVRAPTGPTALDAGEVHLGA